MRRRADRTDVQARSVSGPAGNLRNFAHSRRLARIADTMPEAPAAGCPRAENGVPGAYRAARGNGGDFVPMEGRCLGEFGKKHVVSWDKLPSQSSVGVLMDDWQSLPRAPSFCRRNVRRTLQGRFAVFGVVTLGWPRMRPACADPGALQNQCKPRRGSAPSPHGHASDTAGRVARQLNSLTVRCLPDPLLGGVQI